MFHVTNLTPGSECNPSSRLLSEGKDDGDDKVCSAEALFFFLRELHDALGVHAAEEEEEEEESRGGTTTTSMMEKEEKGEEEGEEEKN
jgi:hypothetical protein